MNSEFSPEAEAEAEASGENSEFQKILNSEFFPEAKELERIQNFKKF